MLTLIIIYTLIAWIVTHYFMVFQKDCNFKIIIGVLWPLWPLALLMLWLSHMTTSILVWFKHGCRYYKKEIHQCCGQCRHIQYWHENDPDSDLARCELGGIKGEGFSSRLIAHDCKKFKKNRFWRFTIRTKF